MQRKCVFCAQPVKKKSKEHIIPQWLLRLTGDPNREVFLGINYPQFDNWDKNKKSFLRKYRFSSFQFPACSICNSTFSELENNSKRIIEKILNGNVVNIGEIDTLLDWFDKIRIGLWLGYYLLNNNMANISPKFGIKKRLASKDRMLAIYHYNGITNGINFSGADTLAFQHFPSCFGFRINQYYFLNISADYYFSRSLGFPYISNPKIPNGDLKLTTGKLVKGTEKVKNKVLKKDILNTNLIFIQPIFNDILYHNELPDDYYFNNEFIRKNTLSLEDGKGAIFIPENGNGFKGISNPKYKIRSTLYDYSNKLPPNAWVNRFSRMIYNYQIHLLTNNIPSTELLDKEDQKLIRSQIMVAKKHNKTILENFIM